MKSSLSVNNLVDKNDLVSCTESPSCTLPVCSKHNWTLQDAIEKQHKKGRRFPLTAFNHLAREVLDLEKSKSFYVDILGFEVIPRPPLDSEGYWLYGNNLNLHLVKTTVPRERRQVKVSRIQHFSSALPIVDHMAFLTTDINAVKDILDAEDVYYKFCEQPGVTGIKQIFLFDPDGNVIEISNCAPEIGEISCSKPEVPKPEEEIVSRPYAYSEDTATTDISALTLDD
jgi:glyoxylase I family protein